MRRRRPTVRTTFGRRIGVHDRQQFELKLEYQPRRDTAQSRYLVDVYVCTPSSLNVNPYTAPPEALYADIHNYVRFKRPETTLEEILSDPASPLRRAARSLDAVERGEDSARLVYDCKLFASVFRASLRDLVQEARGAVAAGEGGLAELTPYVGETLDTAAKVLEAYRRLGARAEADSLPVQARAAYRLVDEYTSLSLEQAARAVVSRVSRAQGEHEDLNQRLIRAILEQDGYRRERGYPSLLESGTDNEVYLSRASLLKKYCSSALFLQIHRHEASRRWQEIFMAVAAGIAMAFATAVAFWAQNRYGRLGLQVFLIFVVSYMFKDRIKEGFRALFSGYVRRRFYDRRIRITDPAGGTLGVCREKIEWVAPKDLPPDVVEIRRRTTEPVERIAEEDLHETVYHYRKEILLDTAKVEGGRLHEGVTDIVRFHISRLLREMDEPYQKIEWIDLESQRIDHVRAAKVYHVDVAFRFTRDDGDSTTSLMRLILDRKGIKRIERSDVDGETGAGSDEGAA